MQQPWDVPRTEEGRDRLIALLAEYRASRQEREAGICLSRLAYLVKHVGAVEGGNAFKKSAELGAEAVAVLRKVGDKKELSRALRMAAVTFLADCGPLLAESLGLAQEIGDVEEEAWTTFQMRGVGGGPDPMTERALVLFQQCGSLEGQASCLRVMGFRIGNHNPEMLQRSIDLYEEAGNKVEAERGLLFLQTALMPDDPDAPTFTDEDIEKLGRMFVEGGCEDEDGGGEVPKS